MPPPADTDPAAEILSPTLIRRDGWTARVIKNEDDDGWAVEMTRAGDPEPALVGPWTMGRDKKNPKPLDVSAFNTLVKTASEVIRRHEHAAHARRHRSMRWTDAEGRRLRAELEVAADEDDPHAILTCFDDVTQASLRRGRVAPDLRLTAARLDHFLATGEA